MASRRASRRRRSRSPARLRSARRHGRRPARRPRHGAAKRIAELADPLHFGTFGGWPVRWLWCAFGAMLTALCATGVYLYGLRAADALRSAQRRRPA
ncbi:PepSY-associated TM helix domain-containing protein [Luteimonas sp. FCS-9]|uniref:PepSY domain-containing protein n=1 Tax=Luteimonas sp. FCS-9 TaxID=1547516 RepID=UPI0009E46518|nr:PepSY-associated TM helix domain-containing protein [Luteimonas sp. FCS-9]